MKPFITKSFIVLSALAIVAAIQSAAWAGATADVTAAVSGGTVIGAGVVSTDGTGETVKAKVARGRSALFDVCVENQEGFSDTVTATSVGDQGKVLATWKDQLNSAPISDSAITAGYARTVTAAQKLCMTLRIKVKDTAKVHSSKTWLVTGDLATSLGDLDTGGIKVTVKA